MIIYCKVNITQHVDLHLHILCVRVSSPILFYTDWALLDYFVFVFGGQNKMELDKLKYI